MIRLLSRGVRGQASHYGVSTVCQGEPQLNEETSASPAREGEQAAKTRSIKPNAVKCISRLLLLVRRRGWLLAGLGLWLLLRILHWDAARNGAVRRDSRAHGLRRLLWLLLGLWLRIVLRIVPSIVFVLVGGGAGESRSCLAGVARTEDDLPRNALALISDHDHVVAGTLQKLGEDVMRRPRTKITEDPLIL